MVEKVKQEYEVEEFIDAKTVSLDYIVIRDEVVWFRMMNHPIPPAQILKGKPSIVQLIPREDPLHKEGYRVVKELVKALAPAHDMF